MILRMRLTDLLSVLEELAPIRYAESWDNVGLLVGDAGQRVSRVLLTIDYTAEVAAEARRRKCDVVVSYHPPIFEPLKRVTWPSLIHDAVRRGVAIYSPHTALDVAEGGTNDVLAEAMRLYDRRALRVSSGPAGQCKLVVFVPPYAVDKVASALFEAGAGRIGNYRCCAFRTPGTGSFFGQAGAHPAAGKAGKLERVDEFRLEMVVPMERLREVVRALQDSHPYEEPAYDLVQLASGPEGPGQGRIGVFPSPVLRQVLFARIKRELGMSRLLIAGPTKGAVKTAAVGAGACGDLINDALAQKAELYLTGEVRHHDALKAAEAGMTVVCTLHSNSERAVLKRLGQRITEKLPKLPVHISQADRDPFTIV